MKKALCILSGGMDSTLCAYLAQKQGYELVALHFDYKQRTQDKEKECFKKICEALGLENSYILNASFIESIGANALTDKSLAIPKNKISSKTPSTYVPFRNGIFLSIAGALAEKEGCKSIFLGLTQEDRKHYPDCTPSFIQKAQDFINEGRATKLKISIKTPLIHLRKKDIVSLALKEGVPLELTWSCYESELLACGECQSCLLRLRGFKEAGARDKLAYKKVF